jgi:hypothetical protein
MKQEGKEKQKTLFPACPLGTEIRASFTNDVCRRKINAWHTNFEIEVAAHWTVAKLPSQIAYRRHLKDGSKVGCKMSFIMYRLRRWRYRVILGLYSR